MYKRIIKRQPTRDLDKWVNDRLARVNAKLIIEQQQRREALREMRGLVLK